MILVPWPSRPLPIQDVTADAPVGDDQVLVDGGDSAQAPGGYPVADRGQQVRVPGRHGRTGRDSRDAHAVVFVSVPPSGGD